MIVRWSACILIVLALSAGRLVAAQDPPSANSSGIEERVVVRIVQLPLIATDRQGRPVTDLRAEEIKVKLRGRPAPVSYLERVSEAHPQKSAAADVRLHLDAPGSQFELSRPGSTEVRYLVLLIDAENDDPLRREEAREKAAAFVREQLDPSLRVGIFSYDGKLNLELPFSDDRAALESAVQAAFSRFGRPRLQTGTRMRGLLTKMQDCAAEKRSGSTVDRQCLRDVVNEYDGEWRPRAEDFIRALQDLVAYLSGLRNAKSVVVLGHGLPIDSAPVLTAAARAIFGNADQIGDLQGYIGFGTQPRAEMDRLLETLVRQRISLSFVDRTAPPTGDFQASRGEMLEAGMFPNRAEYDAAVADMVQIATTSGGTHIRSTDVSSGLKRALDTLNGSYELGFEADTFVDLKTKVSVDCLRRGVKLSYGRGVVAVKDRVEPVMPGRFVLTRRTSSDTANTSAVHQPFLIELQPKAIGYEVAGDQARADFTIHLKILSEDSSQLAETFHFINHSYDAAVWKSEELAPVTLQGWFEAPPGKYVLQAWIRNVLTGREGTIRGEVDIAPIP